MFSVVCVLSVLVCGLGASDPTRTAWTWTPRSTRWERVPNVLPDRQKVLTVTVPLKQRNLDKLEAAFWENSNPKSPKFAQHYTLEQLRDLVAPSDTSVQIVKGYLAAYGAKQITLLKSGDVIKAKMTVEQVETAFRTTLAVYVHKITGTRVIRTTGEYSLPHLIAPLVDLISGLHGFPALRFSTVQMNEGVKAPIASDTITPDYLYKAYAVNQSTSHVDGNSEAVVEFGNNYYSASDLQQFFKAYDPVMVGQDINGTYGPNTNPRTSTEANLDVQYIMAMGNFIDTFIYTQAVDSDIIDAFLEYATFVNSQDDPSLVQSISFGEYGGDYDNSTVQRLNIEFQKMGARGVSVLLASGDNGVGCNQNCTSFEFDFPSSPYITMVGATVFQNQKETGATLSSGGFSLDYYRPSYQDDAVLGYFNSGVTLPSSSYYYANGRAYPDIAAAGVNVQIYNKGSPVAVSGTSCSAPIVAGMIALVNGQRMREGKASLGFLNQFFYANPGMFLDITVGNNKKCPVLTGCCCPGFDAYKGWDPVTGLGSPVYPLILSAALTLP